MMPDESLLQVALALIADLRFFYVLLLCLTSLLRCSGVCCWVAGLKRGDKHRKLGMEGKRGVGDEASIITGKTTNGPHGPVGMCEKEKSVLLAFVNIFSFFA